ncbi:response regulator [bacterium]|nr:response regulator [bacterium]MDB4716493.1 response regulator [bacterium]
MNTQSSCFIFDSRPRRNGLEAMTIFREQHDDIGVIVTDQRMPNETGTEFLQKAALLKPSVIRILSTAYADVDAAVDSVNKGGVYRYITKPWEVPSSTPVISMQK